MNDRIALGLDARRLRPRNLLGQVVEKLGIQIVCGELAPDKPFPTEADLADNFGVSRSVIREAVKTLAARGLLESKTRTGIRVLPPLHWNLLDGEALSWRYRAMPPVQFFNELFELRLMIEPNAAALAAERAAPEDLVEINDAFKAMSEANQANNSGVEADLRFHRGILAASHNQLLLQMGHLIGAGLLISHRFSRESFEIFLPQHRQVMRAIEAHKPESARRTMERLLADTRAYLKDHIRND